MSQKTIKALFTRCMLVAATAAFTAACTLGTMGCGGEPFESGLFDPPETSVQPDAKSDVQPEAGEDAIQEDTAAEKEAAIPDALPEADTSTTEDGSGPDAAEEDALSEVSPEAEPDVVAETGEDAVGIEAEAEAQADAPEEPPTGICGTQGHDGKIMVHTEVVLGPSAYLTVFGMLVYSGDAGNGATPFEGWCWSPQGGQGTLDCFPKDNGQEAAALPKTKVVTQLGTTTSGPSGPPSFYLCDFGLCPVNVVFCAGKTEACRWTAGVPSGDVVYKEPGHEGKGELVCTLP